MKKYLLFGIALVLLAGAYWYFLPQTEEVLFGSDSGALSPGTTADDATIGTLAWSNPNNSQTSDNVNASTPAFICGASTVTENSVKIVKGGTIVGDEKSTGAGLTTSDVYVSYGGATDLWGTTFTADDINASTFGVVFSLTGNGGISHYLNATNFGFSVPAGATIDGILVEVEQRKITSSPC